jgi:hypothetical protein
VRSDITEATRVRAIGEIGAGEITTGASLLPGKQARPPARIVGDPVADPTQATRRLYASDWVHFSAWCREQGLASLPTSPQTFAAYLLSVAPGLSRGALGRRRAAIGTMHRQSGLPTPLLDVATQKALRASARPRTTSRPAAPSSGDLRRLAKSWCRAAVASTFLAGLELTKDGTIDVQQESAWTPIHVRAGQGPASGEAPNHVL